MRFEIAALHANNNWSLVLFEPSMNVVGYSWVYKIKRRTNGIIDRYKVHLVARGFMRELTTPKPPVLLLKRLLFDSFLSLLYLTISRSVSLMYDTTKRLMSSPKCRSVEVINNPARPGSNHREVNCINYK